MTKELIYYYKRKKVYMCVCTMSSWDHLGMLKYYVISNWEPAIVSESFHYYRWANI